MANKSKSSSEFTVSDVTLQPVPHLSDYIPDLLRTHPNPLDDNPFFHPVSEFYITPSDVILRHILHDLSGESPPTGPNRAYHRAGPRKQICFDPSRVRAAIVTCGGLCPGMNTVIRELVVGLWELYGVREIFGIRAGYRGFYSGEPVELSPKIVHGWHKIGGTVLETSRGGFDLDKILNAIQDRGFNQVRFVAVGNEPFLTSYSGQFQSFIMPALTNLQQSLAKANLAGPVKLVVPCNADAYESSLPSQGAFRPELAQTITQLVSFLNSNGSPFVVNIYPFLSLYGNSDFPQDYAFFGGTTHSVPDGPNIYENAFDGNFDTLVSALTKLGYPQMPIVVGEIGWPSDGNPSANLSAARAFNQGLVNRVLTSKGTPLRPGVPPMDLYLFSLFDEGAKSVLPGNFERHWGIFSFDGQAKYRLSLGDGSMLRNARRVGYLPSRWCVANPTRDLSAVVNNHFKLACSYADCTTLNYGGSCNGIGEKGNVSYAFNSYYQVQKQNPRSCEFDGLGMITFLDPSVGDCRFLVGVADGKSLGFRFDGGGVMAVFVAFWGFVVFWF